MAQSVTASNLTVKDGLPSSEVYDVLQDKKGFIWFATDNGVARYDGYEMTVFGIGDGLEDPVVFQLFEDHKARVWFRTFSNRLYYWENGKIVAYPHNDLILNRNVAISSMLIDSLDRMWVTAGRLFSISADGKLTEDSLNLRNKTLWIEAIYNINGKIYAFQSNADADASTRHARVVLYINGKPFSTEMMWPLRPYIRAVSWHGRLYISMGSSIFEYDGASLKKVYTTSAQIIALTLDSRDHLWLGYYNNGIERFSIPDFKRAWRPDFTSNKTVTQIYIDREDGLWLTTLEGGVFYVPDVDVKSNMHTKSSKVKAVAAGDDEIVVGAYDESVTWFDAQSEKITGSKTKQSTILGLFKDSRGNTWLSTARGLQLLDKKSKNALIFHYPDHRCRDFTEDADGNIWGITSVGRTILSKFDSTGKVLSAKYYPYMHTRNMLLAGSTVYVASTLGLHVYDTSMTKVQESPSSLAKFKISKMLSINDTTLLICTIGNGLLVVNNKNWSYEKYNATDRLIASNIYTAEIKDTMLWLGTEKGILTGAVRALLEKSPRFQHFSSSHGLIDDKVNFLVLTDEKAWAFSDYGISVVPFSSIYRNVKAPQFYFKKIHANKNLIDDVNSEFYLPYDQTNIEIEFGFLSLRNQNVSSRYRLTRNEPWTYTNERILRFASLAPGNYDLELQHSTDNFHWTAVNFPLRFVVTPPWWLRWFTQLLAVLFVGCIIFLFVRYRYRSIHRQQQALMELEFETLERERNRIAKELHDGVATNLSAIKLMVNHLLRRHKEPLAPELDEHFLLTIKEIKTIIYGLTPSGLERDGLFKGLQNYIDRLNNTLPFKIHLALNGEEVYTPNIGLLTFRIIQELLSNSVKHSGATHIYIRIESTHDQLDLVFEDDGVGFTFDDSKGHGLANIKSRIKSVKGKMKFESTTELTSFIISIPRR